MSMICTIRGVAVDHGPRGQRAVHAALQANGSVRKWHGPGGLSIQCRAINNREELSLPDT